MLGVFAYYHYDSLALNDFAFIANFLYGRFNPHYTPFLSYLERHVIRPFVGS